MDTPGTTGGQPPRPGHARQHKSKRRNGGPESSGGTSTLSASPGMTLATPAMTLQPRGFTVMQFMEARSLELNSLLHSVQQNARTRHSLQSLPRHMRRRAVSHNPKRLPRRLREAGRREMLRSLQPGQKLEKPRRPRKWYRQRAANRQAEYGRRQGNIAWLETHVWHAKRFKMVDSWGCRIPEHPCDKSVRAAYRAMCRHCLIQDISYYGCIELTGLLDDILSFMGHFTDPDTGVGFGSVNCHEGTVEGATTLYRRDAYPHGALGPVTFMFRPRKDPPTLSEHQLWLWVHPACQQDILQQLQSSSSDVSVTSVGHELARFQLIGPLAAATLETALDIPPLENGTVQPGEVLARTVGDPRLNMPGKRTKVTPPAELGYFRADSTQHTGDLRADSMLGTGKSSTEPSLWDADVRRNLLQTAPSGRDSGWDVGQGIDWSGEESRCVAGNDGPVAQDTTHVARDDGHAAEDEDHVAEDEDHVAGDVEHVARNDSGVVPILLVHQQGCTAGPTGFGEGWDVIVPAGWAMAFWLGFIYRGARAGGLREMRKLYLESNRPFFPDDYPDTAAHRSYSLAQAAQLREQHSRYPPGKRPNFARLGTAAPFHCPWDDLVRGWEQLSGTSSPGQSQRAQHSGTSSSGQSHEAQLSGTSSSGQPQGAQLSGTSSSGQSHEAQLSGTSSSGQSHEAQLSGTSSSGQPQWETVCVARGSRIRQQLSKLYSSREGQDSGQLLSQLGAVLTHLVVVRVQMVSRGTPVARAMICAPTMEDVAGGVASDPVEPPHREERGNDGCDIVQHCSRVTIGYVTEGANSLSEGRGVGMGLCVVQALLAALQAQQDRQPPVVLVRNPNSAQYRFAHVTVV